MFGSTTVAALSAASRSSTTLAAARTTLGRATSVAAQHRLFSKRVPLEEARTVNAGKGGYSSNKPFVATVFGATGFVGRYVVDKLASQGITTIIPYRGDDMEVRHLKLMGDLGRVNPVPYDPRVVDSVRDVVAPSNLVINLIGKDFETKHFFGSATINYTYDQVHAEIPRMLAQVCAEQDVDQFIHMSSLAARRDAPSKVHAAKLQGEIAVRSHFPDATIFRPANIFGDEDRFLNTIAMLSRRLSRFGLVNRGHQKVQPVYVNDVAKAIVNTVQDPSSLGQTYNLAGPDVHTMREVTEFVYHVIGRPPQVIDLPTDLLILIGRLVQQLPNPPFTADSIVQQTVDNIIQEDEENHLPELLGTDPISMEYASYRFLHQYQLGGHFMESANI